MRIGIIPADPSKPARFEEHDRLTLEILQDRVGGYIQAVVGREMPNVQPEIFMWCNEEAKVVEPPLPLNRIATIIAYVGKGIATTDRIHGDVVFTGGPDGKGGHKDLDAKQAHWFQHMIEIRAFLMDQDAKAAADWTPAELS